LAKEEQMALGVMTWKLPATGSSEQYAEQAKNSWIPTVLAQPGVREFRGYRTQGEDFVSVRTETEFTSLELAQQWMNSAEYARIEAELVEHGAREIVTETWDASPLIPDPLRPGS
jgi:heme-degrading monooxygenase HmoA